MSDNCLIVIFETVYPKGTQFAHVKFVNKYVLTNTPVYLACHIVATEYYRGYYYYYYQKL